MHRYPKRIITNNQTISPTPRKSQGDFASTSFQDGNLHQNSASPKDFQKVSKGQIMDLSFSQGFA